MNEIATVLTSIKTAVDIAKLIKESSSSLAEAEQKFKLAELIEALADVKMEMAEVQSTLLEKDETISTLKKSLKTKESLQYETPYYWSIDGEKKDGPFCQICWDTKNMLVRLQPEGIGKWRCKPCNVRFNDKNYVPPPKKPPRGANGSFPSSLGLR